MAVILVVEDEAFLRMIAERMIQDWGHQTLSAGDVDEALSLLRSPQHIGALFTDIRLKAATFGGFELAHEAIKLRPKLRVLYTTGNSITDKMKALFVEGAHFLPKPYVEQQLQDSMEGLLAA
jgi:DNA-binding NtrC family response regulator